MEQQTGDGQKELVQLLKLAEKRLAAFGYELQEGDEMFLQFSIQKVFVMIQSDCNVSFVPNVLVPIAVDMAVGDFLTVKKTFAPESIAGLDLSAAIKQVQIGDTSTVFATGEGTLTAEQRLDSFLNYLSNHGREQFSAVRRIRW